MDEIGVALPEDVAFNKPTLLSVAETQIIF
jgi:hypothetical protein